MGRLKKAFLGKTTRDVKILAETVVDMVEAKPYPSWTIAGETYFTRDEALKAAVDYLNKSE